MKKGKKIQFIYLFFIYVYFVSVTWCQNSVNVFFHHKFQIIATPLPYFDIFMIGFEYLFIYLFLW